MQYYVIGFEKRGNLEQKIKFNGGSKIDFEVVLKWADFSDFPSSLACVLVW